MERIKFIFYVLKKSWREINHDKLEAQKRIAIALKFRNYINGMVKGIEEFEDTHYYHFVNLLKNGKFRSAVLQFMNIYRNTNVAVFDDNGNVDFKNGKEADEYFGKDEFKPFILIGGFKNEMEYCVAKCDQCIENMQYYVRRREYAKTEECVAELKNVLKKQDDFHGIRMFKTYESFELNYVEK